MKKYFLIKLLVVCIFMYVAYMICDLTKYYIMPIDYSDDEVRVVINDAEITKGVKNDVLIKDDNILFSLDIIKKYFDSYIYFDEKYETVIATGEEDIYKFKLNDKEVNMNGIVKKNNSSAIRIDDKIYVPIIELQELYKINVENNEKIIITTNDTDYTIMQVEESANVKLYKRENSLTTVRINPNDMITIFDTDEDAEYKRVRSQNGILGYIRKDKLIGKILLENVLEEKEEESIEKINLTWEYVASTSPDRNGQKINGVNVISPTWINVKNETGEINNNISKTYINWAKKNGYSIWPTLKNDNLGIDKTSILINDMYAREKLINNLIELVKKYDINGINLDFENMYMHDRDAYSQFVREFSARLRRNDLIPTVDVNVPDGSANWSLCFDQKAISDAADYIIVMAYDQYGILEDGPIASLSWVETSIKKLLDRENVDREKLILGIPFYSKYRKNQIAQSGDKEIQTNISKATLYMETANKYLKNPEYASSVTWSEEMGQYYIERRKQNIVERVWIENEDSIKEKLKLLEKYDLAGVASWRWGFETSNVWKIINESLKNN